MRAALVTACATIALLDAVQPLVRAWEPRLWGAIGGALVYAVCALGIARGWRAPLWVVRLLPVLPLSLIGAHQVGVALPAAPDGWMVGICGVQVFAAVLAWGLPR